MDDQSLTFGDFRLIPAQRVLLHSGRHVRLGSRALDLLLALVARAGEVVGKDELVAAVWPGTFVEETNLRVHIAALRKVLRDDASGAEFITNIPGRGYCFTAPVRGGGAPPLQPAAARRPAPDLAVPLGRVIGRDAVIQALAAQLPGHRLVTIVGPGGIGKTTVALALAAGLPGEAHVVDLAPLQDPRLLPGALASALGHVPRGGDPVQELIGVLRGREMLLLLDSCEHVIEAAASLAAALLRGAPGLRLLATSREPLRCEGEWVQRLPPLELPDPGIRTATEAMRYPAVQLFVERASATLGGYALTDADTPLVGEICRRLDGMALAIELAAGRVDGLGIRGLARSLDDGFRILTRGRRTALPRHQTLRATLDWSYRILPPEEQAILRRIAVFNGDFTLEAAAAVSTDEGDVEEGVTNLVAKSLLSADFGADTVLYRLMETTRVYGRGKLAESGELDALRRRHAAHFLEFFERAEAEWEARPAAEWLEDHLRQIGNLRAALDWAFSPQGDAMIGVALTAAAVPFWIQLSLVDECVARVQQALSQGDATPPRLRMRLTAALGWPQLRAIVGWPSGAAAWAEVLEIATALGDADYRLRALWALWVDRINHGAPRAALELAERFAALAAPSGQDSPLGDRMRARALHLLGDQPGALAQIRGMLGRYVAPENRSHIARFQYDQRITARITLGRVLWVMGRPEQALRDVRENIEDALQLGHALSTCHALADSACFVALLAGELDLAERYIALLHEHTRAHALDVWGAYADGFLGELRLRRGEAEAGLALLRGAIARLEAAGFVLYRTAFLATLAKGLLDAGRPDEALASVDAALGHCAASGEAWILPELQRVRAGVILARGDAASAEALLLEAVRLAAAQGALAWELRAALTLAELRRDQGRIAEARLLLAPVRAKCTEGFDGPDLRAAATLLDGPRAIAC